MEILKAVQPVFGTQQTGQQKGDVVAIIHDDKGRLQ